MAIIGRTCPCGKQFTAKPSEVGKYCSRDCYHRFGNGKGDAVGYSALHSWVSRTKGRPQHCEDCGTTEGRLEWANRSHEYRRDPSDWLALCKRCHARYDSRTCRRGHQRTSENTWVDKQGRPHCRPCRNERLRLQRRGQRAAWDAEKRARQRAIRAKYDASASLRMDRRARDRRPS